MYIPKVLLCFVVSVFIIEVAEASAGNKWGYDKTDGPETWVQNYPLCAGKQQSPISIDVSKVVVNTNLTQFNFKNIHNITNVKMTLENNGHSVQVDLQGNDLKVSGGGLLSDFKVQQFHFHWGSIDKRGSEHSFNGRLYPMEMHLVLYDSQYSRFEDALNKTDGLAVLAFLFEIGETNHRFDEIISHLTAIAHKDDHTILQTFSLDSLFPGDTAVYYRYHGSLTTPPCYESVIWTIFKSHIKISEQQIQQFRTQVHRNYANETDRDLSDDFRPVQELNHRVVMTNNELGRIYGSGATNNLINVQLCGCLLTLFYITFKQH